ncbi:MAG: TRAP transporter small permease [Desulfobacterales bacterium]|jgi:C4-dicarboxylate transporter DctQ subunit|nr:MAG: TRAP transporter small permease [Desulfobacterales bacterium]
MAIKNGKMRKKGFDFIIESLAYLAGIIIFAIAVIVTLTAVVRYLGLRTPIWVHQWTEYGLLWFTFLGAAWLLREGGHIRIDTLISRLNQNRFRKVEIMDDILGFIVSAIIFCFGALHSIDLYQRGIMEVKGTTVPKFPLFLIIPIGGLALSIQFGRQFLKKIISKSGPEDE